MCGPILNSCHSQKTSAVVVNPSLVNILSVCLSYCDVVDFAYKCTHCPEFGNLSCQPTHIAGLHV